jgi:enamine deaminase RidA (YjgF/YER057c/UK114 family)
MTRFITHSDADHERYGLTAGAIAGNLVFVGTMAMDLDTLARKPEAVTIADETRLCLESLERTLGEAGCGLGDLLKVNCYLAEDGFRGEFWAAYDERLAPYRSTAVRLTQVAGIAGGCRVQLDAIALRPS